MITQTNYEFKGTNENSGIDDARIIISIRNLVIFLDELNIVADNPEISLHS